MTVSSDIDAVLNAAVEVQASSSKRANDLDTLIKALSRLQSSLPTEKIEHENDKRQAAITTAEAEQRNAESKTQAARLKAALAIMGEQ
jgi:hypothetical protein